MGIRIEWSIRAARQLLRVQLRDQRRIRDAVKGLVHLTVHNGSSLSSRSGNAMNIPTNLRTLPDASGAPAFVVLPIKTYAALVAKVRSATRRKTIPHEVVSLMVDGYSAARAWREYRGLTQAAVARRMRITQPALAQIESSVRPRKATRVRLAKALGISIDQLTIR